MKRLVNAITCMRFVFALILVLAVLLGKGTAAWLGRRPPMCAACYG